MTTTAPGRACCAAGIPAPAPVWLPRRMDRPRMPAGAGIARIRTGSYRWTCESYLRDRGDGAGYIRELLTATASRPPYAGCFGLHEWAMVYRPGRTPAPVTAAPGAERHGLASWSSTRSGARTSTRSGSSRPQREGAEPDAAHPGHAGRSGPARLPARRHGRSTNGRLQAGTGRAGRCGRWTASRWPLEIRPAGHAGFAVRPGVLRASRRCGSRRRRAGRSTCPASANSPPGPPPYAPA